MATLLIKLSVLFGVLFVASALNCTEKCDLNRCPTPIDCFAGIIKDKCNCCSICGQFEGYRCWDDKLKGLDASYENYDSCGENLECRIREDLGPNEPLEALCYCSKDEMICGSDGQTYENICQLTEARYKRRDGLVPMSRGPCQSAPKLVTKPANLNESLGSNAAFMCQVTGWPIPEVHWKVIRKNPHEIRQYRDLPSDDSHIAVQFRGGSKSLEVTSWLQIIKVRKEDEGEYHCVANNEIGDDFAYGILTLIEDVKKNEV